MGSGRWGVRSAGQESLSVATIIITSGTSISM